MDILTKIHIVPELTKIILFYARLLDQELRQDLKLVFTLPKEYRLLFLRIEFSKRSHNPYDIANLILTAFVQGRQTIIHEIISAAFPDNIRDLFDKQMTNPNTFFEPTWDSHITVFQKALFQIALKTNQISTLKLLCSDISGMHSGELLWYFSDRFCFTADADYMASVIEIVY
jgi:hypothetical protein